MKAVLNWQGDLKFTGRADSGHELTIDGPPAIGGNNEGLRPMELVLLGVGSCSAMDVIYILKKSRQDIEDCVVELEGARAESDPKVFTDIHLNFKVSGKGLNERQVARAVKLSAEKYCSASIMLRESVNITHSHEIVES